MKRWNEGVKEAIKKRRTGRDDWQRTKVVTFRMRETDAVGVEISQNNNNLFIVYVCLGPTHHTHIFILSYSFNFV